MQKHPSMHQEEVACSLCLLLELVDDIHDDNITRFVKSAADSVHQLVKNLLVFC